jgi:DnaJ-class molecular chaperone
MPSAIRRVRTEPLPAGVDVLLSVVAGDEAVQGEAAKRTEREPAMVKEAATFFVEQILLTPGTGSYRALGATRETASTDIRHNMALLLRWLHPDKLHSDERRALAERVTLAWEDLKTPERRAAYDAKDHGSKPKTSGRNRYPAPVRRAGAGGPRGQGPSFIRLALFRLFGL